MPGEAAERILIIKHGALGDIVMATGVMRAIRSHHPTAAITLLTRPDYAGLFTNCPMIDAVWIDRRPKFWDAVGIAGLRRRLRSAGFRRVYDLQTSKRTRWYHWLLGPEPRPEWCGHVRGTRHSYVDPVRETQHTLDRLPDQLRQAGIMETPAPNIAWMEQPIADLPTDRPLAVFAPGSSAHRPEKRWPIDRFAALAQRLDQSGFRIVAVGGADERELGEAIAKACPTAIDLVTTTSIGQLAWLAGRAALAIGNDSGPMHVLAVGGCACTVLFSGASDPARTAPRGRSVSIVQEQTLADLDIGRVIEAIEAVRTPAGV